MQKQQSSHALIYTQPARPVPLPGTLECIRNQTSAASALHETATSSEPMTTTSRLGRQSTEKIHAPRLSQYSDQETPEGICPMRPFSSYRTNTNGRDVALFPRSASHSRCRISKENPQLILVMASPLSNLSHPSSPCFGENFHFARALTAVLTALLRPLPTGAFNMTISDGTEAKLPSCQANTFRPLY